MGKGCNDFSLPQYIIPAKPFQYTVDPGYNDIGLCDTSPIALDML